MDFRNTVLIMTSNIGSQAIQDESNSEQREAVVRSSLKEFFRPEFINRIDEIVIFDRLRHEDLDRIVLLQVKRVIDRLAGQNITLTVDEGAIRLLASAGYDDTGKRYDLNGDGVFDFTCTANVDCAFRRHVFTQNFQVRNVALRRGG